MSYNPTQWSAGDTVTSAKLNKIEQGISSNGVLEINAVFDEETGVVSLDKTWQEIYNANNSVIIMPTNSAFPIRANVISIGRSIAIFYVECRVEENYISFNALTPNDYPSILTSSDDKTPPVAN